MTALRKPYLDAFEHDADVVGAGALPVERCEDAFGYNDDVSVQGIALLRERAAERMGNKKWKVIDGYAGDRDTVVG